MKFKKFKVINISLVILAYFGEAALLLHQSVVPYTTISSQNAWGNEAEVNGDADDTKGDADDTKGDADDVKTIFHGKDFRSKALMLHSAECVDLNENCPSWAKIGECSKNPGYMHQSCKKSCGVCGESAAITDPGVPGGSGVPGAPGVPTGNITSPVSWLKLLAEGIGVAAGSFIPYIITVYVMAFIWIRAGGMLPPVDEKPNNGKDFAYSLCSLEHVFHGHMWICVCSLCCIPIRMADNYSKSNRAGGDLPKPIIKGFWTALAIMLVVHFVIVITGGFGWILGAGIGVYFRQKLRQMYKLPHGTGKVMAWDCLFWLCCPCCTIAQETRQVQFVTSEPLAGAPVGVSPPFGYGEPYKH